MISREDQPADLQTPEVPGRTRARRTHPQLQARSPQGAPRKGRRARYVNDLEKVRGLPPGVRVRLQPVVDRFAFRANDYYLRLIDWSDPNDPIRRIVIPREEELTGGGELDASNECAVTVAKGTQHKYPHTVLLLCNEVCGAYCRYCFRKRLFMEGNDEASLDVSEGLRYIAAHPEVTNVLLTGGDPLLMSTRRLESIIKALRKIPHVRIIRLGSKMPAFDPWRVLGDEKLQEVFRRYSTPRRRIYLACHFDHPRELTEPALEGLDCCIRSGLICVNQCPLIGGVNDDADVLSDLYRKLSWAGCPPYYLFQCRPTAGNEHFEVPLVRGSFIFQEAMRHGSGLARRARYVMSHASGKVEILGVDDRHIYLRYHRAKLASDRGRFLICRRDDEARWLDDLEEIGRFDAGDGRRPRGGRLPGRAD